MKKCQHLEDLTAQSTAVTEFVNISAVRNVHKAQLGFALGTAVVGVVLMPVVTKVHEINSFAPPMEVGNDAKNLGVRSLLLEAQIYVRAMEAVDVVLSMVVKSLLNLQRSFA